MQGSGAVPGPAPQGSAKRRFYFAQDKEQARLLGKSYRLRLETGLPGELLLTTYLPRTFSRRILSN